MSTCRCVSVTCKRALSLVWHRLLHPDWSHLVLVNLPRVFSSVSLSVRRLMFSRPPFVFQHSRLHGFLREYLAFSVFYSRKFES